MVELDLEEGREEVAPKDAATLVILREAATASRELASSLAGDVEVFCVERHRKSGFLGGAVVFPGGKLDAADEDGRWDEVVTGCGFVGRERALAIAACRESLEEAAILPVAGGELEHRDLLEIRERAKEESLPVLLGRLGLRVDLGRLGMFARWVTPVAESRRFDTRFFVTTAPARQVGAHDERETMASFWARPADVLVRFDRDEVQLAPPTHRTLELLARKRSVREGLELAVGACLEPIRPRLVRHRVDEVDTLALVLPGDPEHEVKERRIAGSLRFVLHGRRWLPSSA